MIVVVPLTIVGLCGLIEVPAGRTPVLFGELVKRCDDPTEPFVEGPGFAGWR